MFRAGIAHQQVKMDGSLGKTESDKLSYRKKSTNKQKDEKWKNVKQNEGRENDNRK